MMQNNGYMDGFIPFVDNEVGKIPFFSEATLEKRGVRGHATRKSLPGLEEEIRKVIGQLGGTVTGFQYGKYEEKPLRYGVIVYYIFGIQRGRFNLKTLPVKNEDKTYRTGAIKQALFTLHMALESAYNMRLLAPDFSAAMLIGHLLVPGKDKTFVKVLQENNEIPNLIQPGQSKIYVTEGEITDGEIVD
jgi:hypothetical protein